MKKLISTMLLIFSVTSAYAGSAIHWDPFDGGWFPAGTYGVVFYGVNTSASKIMNDGDAVAEGITFENNMFVTRIASWHEIGNVPLHLSIVFPFGRVEAPGPMGQQSATGMADPELVSSVRALHWEGGYLNVGLSAFFPIGTYDHNNMSLGNNYWVFRPSVNLGHNLGRFHIDLWAAADIHTDNGKYGPNKDTLEKDPLFFSELHLSYILLPESLTTVSASIGGIWGGKEEVDGIEITGKQADYAIKVSFGTNLTEGINLGISLSSDLAVKNGPKGQTTQVKLTKIF